jgi:hypothetical protein
MLAAVDDATRAYYNMLVPILTDMDQDTADYTD